ncbi:hypothetical protein PGTUg99_022223 [Puccinia graminis f. sp. tritici]|uniref:Uncharacterized protein n=1 Tax=Puccinia graminis f. sp. tritici TaxID=56615 RepID=A0A5B0RXT0_PUCGR|nr:hypothetical protein PGTUg99_022223 [Puccinia graminis f. sp. tritici]
MKAHDMAMVRLDTLAVGRPASHHTPADTSTSPAGITHPTCITHCSHSSLTAGRHHTPAANITDRTTTALELASRLTQVFDIAVCLASSSNPTTKGLSVGPHNSINLVFLTSRSASLVDLAVRLAGSSTRTTKGLNRVSSKASTASTPPLALEGFYHVPSNKPVGL